MENLKKDEVLVDLNNMLAFINKHFAWLAVEIALSVQERIGYNNDFVKSAFNGVIEDLSRNSLDGLIPECSATEENTSSFSNYDAAFSQEEAAKLLSKSAFSLDEEVAEECQAWDEGTDSSMSMGMAGEMSNAQTQKLNIIAQMQANIDKLHSYKEAFEKETDFKNELELVDVMLESLDFEM